MNASQEILWQKFLDHKLRTRNSIAETLRPIVEAKEDWTGWSVRKLDQSRVALKRLKNPDDLRSDRVEVVAYLGGDFHVSSYKRSIMKTCKYFNGANQVDAAIKLVDSLVDTMMETGMSSQPEKKETEMKPELNESQSDMVEELSDLVDDGELYEGLLEKASLIIPLRQNWKGWKCESAEAGEVLRLTSPIVHGGGEQFLVAIELNKDKKTQFHLRETDGDEWLQATWAEGSMPIEGLMEKVNTHIGDTTKPKTAKAKPKAAAKVAKELPKPKFNTSQENLWERVHRDTFMNKNLLQKVILQRDNWDGWYLSEDGCLRYPTKPWVTQYGVIEISDSQVRIGLYREGYGESFWVGKDGTLEMLVDRLNKHIESSKKNEPKKTPANTRELADATANWTKSQEGFLQAIKIAVGRDLEDVLLSEQVNGLVKARKTWEDNWKVTSKANSKVLCISSPDALWDKAGERIEIYLESSYRPEFIRVELSSEKDEVDGKKIQHVSLNEMPNYLAGIEHKFAPLQVAQAKAAKKPAEDREKVAPTDSTMAKILYEGTANSEKMAEVITRDLIAAPGDEKEARRDTLTEALIQTMPDLKGKWAVVRYQSEIRIKGRINLPVDGKDVCREFELNVNVFSFHITLSVYEEIFPLDSTLLVNCCIEKVTSEYEANLKEVLGKAFGKMKVRQTWSFKE